MHAIDFQRLQKHCGSWPTRRAFHSGALCLGISQLAVGQNQWYHFGVGAPPILEPILVGIGMFTGGAIWILTHGQFQLVDLRACHQILRQVEESKASQAAKESFWSWYPGHQQSFDAVVSTDQRFEGNMGYPSFLWPVVVYPVKCQISGAAKSSLPVRPFSEAVLVQMGPKWWVFLFVSP